MKGKCLCGLVKIEFNSLRESFDVCHCGICRNWGGGPAFTVENGENLTINGDEHIAYFKSSAWAERGFCKNCGTHILFRMPEQNFLNFSAGLFEDFLDLTFSSQIFIDHKPKNYEFANSTETYSEDDIINGLKK